METEESECDELIETEGEEEDKKISGTASQNQQKLEEL